MKDNIQSNNQLQIYHDELYLKIQGIKIFCMIIQNDKKYYDYKFRNSECINFWSKFHLLCHFINNDVNKFNKTLSSNKKTKSKLIVLNDLSYEINVCSSALKKFKKFNIKKNIDMHLKRRVYFKYCINDYLAGGDIQLIHPLTTERCEVSYHNGHHHIFIFEGKNIEESQITLDDEYQFTINFEANTADFYKVSILYIYKYLNKGYIPTILRNERLMGFDHFCSHRPLKEILKGDKVCIFNIESKIEN